MVCIMLQLRCIKYCNINTGLSNDSGIKIVIMRSLIPASQLATHNRNDSEPNGGDSERLHLTRVIVGRCCDASAATPRRYARASSYGLCHLNSS